MPGHASAIAVAYPELMSAPGPYAMERHWGVLKPVLDPTKEATYAIAEAWPGISISGTTRIPRSAA
ncbi:hypothetical protein [Klebsiella aerogenes]|uniref:hypothetical protein n=1 Tax=Klebsiella aerogenes TaxID=548 RepID=UPI0038780D21